MVGTRATWLTPDTPCPWNTRAEFVARKNTRAMVDLRELLQRTTDLQARFLLRRLQNAELRILNEAAPEHRERVQTNFARLWCSGSKGNFALIDYVNFKGEGILHTERYKGKGWGLLQVLEEMSTTEPAVPAFIKSAKAVLTRRVQNSPARRHEKQWLAGWCRRVGRYAN